MSHQNIVTIYDVGEDITSEGKIVYIAMEYLDGQGLDHYIAYNSFPSLQEKIRIIRKIAEGLDYAHKRDIIHRDVKPANIIITEGSIPKLTDFGLARFTDSSLTMSGTIIGTPNYMAPEQVQGKKVDARSDFFALSVILYEMLTQQKPFAGDTITSVIYRVVNEDPIPPGRLNPDVPPVVDRMVIKGLAKSPLDRYQNGSEYIQALDSMLADIELSTGRLDSGSTLILDKSGKATTGLNARLMAGMGIATAAVIISLVFLFWGKGKSANQIQTTPVTTAHIAQSVQPATPVPPVKGEDEGVEQEPSGETQDVDKAVAANSGETPGTAEKKNSVVIRKPKAKPVKQAHSAKRRRKKTASVKHAPPTASKQKPAVVSYGWLTVHSEPDGAEVFIKDKFLGLTPINNLRFRRGKHTIRVAKRGYKPFTKRVEIGKKSSYSVALMKADTAGAGEKETVAYKRRTGALEVITPPQSVIYVDSKEYREKKIRIKDLTPGTHVVYIQIKGSKPFNKRVTIRPGKTELIDVR